MEAKGTVVPKSFIFVWEDEDFLWARILSKSGGE